MFGRSQPRATINAARIIGPLMIAGGALMITQRARMVSALDDVLETDAVLMLAAMAALTAGVLILVLHPYWRGITQIVISLIGVWSVARGGVLLFAPGLTREAAVFLINAPQYLPVIGCGMALLGIWLVVFSFIAPPEDGLGYFS
jgi:hypothetical protein